MQAIMLAAGKGSRLGKYTKNNTKCMLNIHGKTLLERAIDALIEADIKDFIIVLGYKGENVKKYIEGIESGVSTPLMQITSEYHYHTVSADSKETLDEIQKELDESGYLVALRDYEPVDFWSRVDE